MIFHNNKSDHIAISGPSKNTSQKCMIKILFIIMITDRPTKQFIHFPGQSFRITVPYCMEQLLPVPFLCAFIKPPADCCFKYFLNFRIRDHKSRHPLCQRSRKFRFPHAGQISGQIQNTPQIILR